MESSFTQGSAVVYRGHGIGKIVGTEMKGPGGDAQMCFVVVLRSGMRAFMPVQTAGNVLRTLCSKDEAESDLQILRSTDVEPLRTIPRQRREERERILRGGSRTEIATLLRQLYAGKRPASDADTLAIRNLEDLVLEEIALVLEVPRATLESEMRQRYPALVDKKRAH